MQLVYTDSPGVLKFRISVPMAMAVATMQHVYLVWPTLLITAVADLGGG